MSDRKDFAKRLNRKKEALTKGEVIEAPVSRPFVPESMKWSVISLYGPNGPYADADHNTFIPHGAYPTEEAANEAAKKMMASVPGLKYTQTVVWPTGEPLAMPLRPHFGVDRQFGDNQERAQTQWDRMRARQRAEAEELRQRTLLAQKIHQSKHGKASMPDVEVKSTHSNHGPAPSAEK